MGVVQYGERGGDAMYLPGTVNERIGDIRVSKGYSQKELADMIGVAPSQLSRIEHGETQNVNSDILIKLSKALGVSTDYILGLTTISVQKSYDISELGLSEGAVKTLVTKTIKVKILNRLLEHKSFPYMLQLVETYFTDSLAAGIATRNEMIDFMTATLGDFAKGNPDDKTEIAAHSRLIKSQKMGTHEAELEKIKSTFMAILKDIKKDMGEEKVTGDVATAEFFEQVRERIAANPEQPPTADEIADMVMQMVDTQVTLDDEMAEQFRGLMGKLFVPPPNPSVSK
jgi:transcriptional regulator with XRE-family HTH domain